MDGEISGYLLGSRKPLQNQLYALYQNVWLFFRALTRYFRYNQRSRRFIRWLLMYGWREVPARPRRVPRAPERTVGRSPGSLHAGADQGIQHEIVGGRVLRQHHGLAPQIGQRSDVVERLGPAGELGVDRFHAREHFDVDAGEEPQRQLLALPASAFDNDRATWAIIHRPWRMRPGRPTEVANSSSMWMGLKSPLAPW